MKRNDIINGLVAMGYRAEAQESIKNGVVFEGIVIKGEDPIAPVIYTERLIEDAEAQGKSIAEVVADVIKVYEEHRHVELDLDQLMSREFIMNNVYIGIQRESEEDIVKMACDFDGMEAFLYVRGDMEVEAGYSIKVNKYFLAHAYVDVTEAWDRAKENTFAETEIQSIAKMLAEMCGMPYDETIEMDIPMYVITNKCRLRGASAILDRKALEEFAQEHGAEELVVLPSSIHEMIVVPFDGSMDIEEMSAMVREINAAEVKPEERLTDRAYIISL